MSKDRGQKRDERRETILNAARTLMFDIGYEAMTMDALAAQAGLTKPTLYAHFPNKEAIGVASIVNRMRQGLEMVEQFDETQSPLAHLLTIYRWTFVNKFEHRNVPFFGASAEIIRTHPEYCEIYEKLVQRKCALITAGQACGEIDPELTPRVVVQVLTGILRDSEYEELLQRGEINSTELVQTLLTIFTKFLTKKPSGGG
jgi:TetR/AcrR family transcriptional regulator, regulator of autoinduction and epiphytic fitness